MFVVVIAHRYPRSKYIRRVRWFHECHIPRSSDCPHGRRTYYITQPEVNEKKIIIITASTVATAGYFKAVPYPCATFLLRIRRRASCTRYTARQIPGTRGFSQTASDRFTSKNTCARCAVVKPKRKGRKMRRAA